MGVPGRRRLMLAAAAAVAFGGRTPRPARAAMDGSRFLWAVNGAGEEVAAAYRRADGTPDWRVVARPQHLFRDIRAASPGPLPLPLLDIVSLIQEGWRHERPVLLLSGYRTPRTNAAIEGASHASLHMEGMAADIALRGVPTAEVAQAAWAFSRITGFMGVGIYPGFVHVDVGPRRSWVRAGAATLPP
jgi:uncharacterized protein YcbK (DUF882 family)